MIAADSTTSGTEAFRAGWLPYVALAALTVLVYAPTFGYGFVWDDFEVIVGNTSIHALSAAHWKAIWLHPGYGQYAPLHPTLLAVIYRLGGEAPFAYHLTQVLLHASCACALYAMLRRLESPGVAVIAAALFAVHPVNIENVAWATETKSTLALLLFLLSSLCFLRHGKSGRRSDWLVCIFLFALSLLAKASTVVGPAALLLIALREGRLDRGRRWLLGALFVLSAALTLLTLRLHAGQGALGTPDRLADATLLAPGASHLAGIGSYYGGWWVHLLNLPGFLIFYVRQVVWPAQLSVFQMFPLEPGMSVRAALQWSALIAILVLLGWLWFRAQRRDVALWIMWFLGFLAPVLQIVRNPIWVADRYLYIPAIGLFVLFGKLMMQLARSGSQAPLRRAAVAVPILAVVACVWITGRELPAWKSDVSLWRKSLRHCDSSAYCHGMLSIALRRQARGARGEEQAQLRQAAVDAALRAVSLRATPQRFVWLGDALLDTGDPRAIAAYMKTGELLGAIPPHYWTLIARAHYRFGNVEEAGRILASLLPAGADDPNTLLVSSFVAWKQGRPDEARRAVEKIMSMNTLAAPGTNRTLRFISRYWDDPDEAARMLLEVQAP